MITDLEKKTAKWTELYYESLLGATCVKIETEIDEYGDCWPKLIFEHPEQGRLEVEVSCDEEGNRPGFLFGLPSVSKSKNPFFSKQDV